MIFLVLLLFAPLQTSQLPAGGSSSPQHHNNVQFNCTDPLHFAAPGTQCEGSTGRLTAYFMSTFSVDSSNCPSQSVCLSGAEITACPASLLRFLTDENRCPRWAPLRLLEYHNPPSLATEVSAVGCPLRPRCVPLGCFNDFCRSKWQRKSGSDEDDKEAEKASSRVRPALIRMSHGGQCDYLQCGCPATEEVLLAEGCPTRGELLVIRADPINGCPAKLCVNQLPDSLEPVETPAKDTTSSSETSSGKKVQDCSNEAITCPPGTSELTVPNPKPGGCPLRICLMPELLEGAETDGPTAGSATETAKENFSATTRISEDITETSSSTDGATAVTTDGTTAPTTTATTSSNTDIFTTNAPESSTIESSPTPVPPSTTSEEVLNPQSSRFNSTTN